jgi:hypothetical protein
MTLVAQKSLEEVYQKTGGEIKGAVSHFHYGITLASPQRLW